MPRYSCLPSGVMVKMSGSVGHKVGNEIWKEKEKKNNDEDLRLSTNCIGKIGNVSAYHTSFMFTYHPGSPTPSIEQGHSEPRFQSDLAPNRHVWLSVMHPQEESSSRPTLHLTTYSRQGLFIPS